MMPLMVKVVSRVVTVSTGDDRVIVLLLKEMNVVN
jgi:hypothetical protein